MSGRTDRRAFLISALAAAGGLLLAAGGLAGRTARRAASRIRIPLKRFDRRSLCEPHDLAG